MMHTCDVRLRSDKRGVIAGVAIVGVALYWREDVPRFDANRNLFSQRARACARERSSGSQA